jgi:hypothetical protein
MTIQASQTIYMHSSVLILFLCVKIIPKCTKFGNRKKFPKNIQPTISKNPLRINYLKLIPPYEGKIDENNFKN